MSTPEQNPVQTEGRNHRYVGNVIPWYVRLLWVLFWIFAIYYTLTYIFPDMRRELRQPAPSLPQPQEAR